MADFDDYGVGSVIVIVVTVLLVAALVPPAVNSATSADFSSREANVELMEGEMYNLSDTNATVLLNNASSNTANYTISAESDSSQFELSEDQNTTVTVNSIDYTVNVTSVMGEQDTATAIVKYQVSSGGAAQDVWILVPLFIVLAPALLLIAIAMSGKNKI